MEEVLTDVTKSVLLVLLQGAAFVVPILLLFATFWLVGLPLRRRERARLFLDLLEMGMNDGHTPERAIIEVSRCRDSILGARFHLLAEHLQGGLRLDEALRRVPRLLPPQVAAMLIIGVELGDVRHVLPACRQTLQDAVSQMRGAMNYLAILTFIVLPVVPVLSMLLSIYVVPKFEMIAMDMGLVIPPVSRIVFGFRNNFIGLHVLLLLILQGMVLCYVAGPRLRRGLGAMGLPIDRGLWLLPWRRKRVQRDFATMLALLLDAGLPEPRAVSLAAQGADNAVLTRAARRAVEELSAGVKLTEAVRHLDGSGELHWRLTNAAQGRMGFMAALRGWFESLDARAFQQEQAAAHLLTSLLVLWNGLVIGVFVIGMFNLLTGIVEEGVLW